MTPPTPILETAPGGGLLLLQDNHPIPVRIQRCFPWAAPEKWLSLRDPHGNELAMLPDLAQLPPHTRLRVQEEMNREPLPFLITRIHLLRKELELRHWEVDTSSGPRTFQTELDEWPRRLPSGSVLIRDICGDLYRVNDPDSLDPASLKRLWVLLD